MRLNARRARAAFGRLAYVGALLTSPIANSQAVAEPIARPPGIPAPLVPADNPITPAKVALGRQLFFDTRLSVNATQSCASCHRPELAFTDGRATAVGATGELHTRNTPTLFNAAYAATLGWADPHTTTLERQHRIPMFNTRPIELGLTERNVDAVLAALGADPQVAALFEAAFPNEVGKGLPMRARARRSGLRLEHVTHSIASFVRTLVAGNSAYDRYVFYDEPLSASARRGVDLFFSPRTGCSTCHASFNFSGPVNHAASKRAVPVFHNTGLYNVNGSGAGTDRGLALMTHRRRDRGAFRAPTLRNVALTAPYMHDGSVATLGEVVDFYARGGRLIESGALAGDGRMSRYKRDEIRGFELGPSDRADLIAFLQSLTETALTPHTSASNALFQYALLVRSSNAHRSFLSSNAANSASSRPP